jgi:DNA polymerase-1
MLVQVHDDLLFEVPEAELDKAAAVIRQCMEGAVALSVPLLVDIKTGPNWSDMTKVKP